MANHIHLSPDQCGKDRGVPLAGSGQGRAGAAGPRRSGGPSRRGRSSDRGAVILVDRSRRCLAAPDRTNGHVMHEMPSRGRVLIAPSVLASDFLHLADAVDSARTGGADRLHLDVMDGRFVPNISFGSPIVEAIRRHTDMFLEAHLMVVSP